VSGARTRSPADRAESVRSRVCEPTGTNCWSAEQRGHRAQAVDLPTSERELSTDDYAEIIRRQVGGIGNPVVLAHSGSGVLLPAAARALGARHQVWLAAWVPDPDASFSEEVAQHAERAFNPEWIGKDPTTDTMVAANFLYHDCDQQTGH
jgi:hypothetical protein